MKIQHTEKRNIPYGILRTEINQIYYELFRNVGETTKSDHQLRHVCLNVRMEQFNYHWTDLHEILHSSTFRNFVEKIDVSLKSDKNTEHFALRKIYVYDHISLNSDENKKCYRQNL